MLFVSIILLADEDCLSTSCERCTSKSAATTAAAMTKQLTTGTATNAASSITQTANLAPTVISPTTTTSATTTIGATATPTTTVDGAVNAVTEATSTQSQKQCVLLQSRTKCRSDASSETTATKATTTDASSDANGRSAALERAYVHDVYENCEEPPRPVRPRLAQFLGSLEPGSVVCDVGCGSGRYLTRCNPAICTIGIDRCYRLSKAAHETGGEVSVNVMSAM